MKLDTFFNPSSVAIIGASHTPGKVGYEILQNFVRNEYPGKIFPINPDTAPILGKEVYSSILDIKDQIDLAIVAIPANVVPKVLRECVKKKIESVIVVSGGFSETGAAGKKLEDELKKIIQKSKTRLLGPNCIGTLDAHTKLDTLFLSQSRMKRPSAGNIAFISQSGAVGSTILDWLSDEKFGISKFISYGNSSDLNEADFLEYLGKDETTKVIVMYMEGIKSEGKKFVDVLKKTVETKPVIILKAGKTEMGTKAVASHTGSLAGSARIYSAVFNQTNAIEASDWEELFDFAKVFSTQPFPKGNKVAVITDGGGFGVLATDECVRQGLELPEPTKDMIKLFKKIFPPHVILHNPIDLTGDATEERYKIAIEACLKSKNYDGVIAITLFQVPTIKEQIVDILTDMKKYKKPFICCAVGSRFTKKIVEKLENNGIPVFLTPERAVKSFAALVRYSKNMR